MLKLLYGLGYEVVRTSGSHRQLRCQGRPPLVFSFHGYGAGSELSRSSGLLSDHLSEEVRLARDLVGMREIGQGSAIGTDHVRGLHFAATHARTDATATEASAWPTSAHTPSPAKVMPIATT